MFSFAPGGFETAHGVDELVPGQDLVDHCAATALAAMVVARDVGPVVTWMFRLGHGGRTEMRDVHDIYTTFKTEFPELSAQISETSHAIHVDGGPLDEKTRALIKIVAAGAAGHHTALETHLVAAREAGLNDAEILHALLMLVSTCGFPTFMEAYSTFKRMDL